MAAFPRARDHSGVLAESGDNLSDQDIRCFAYARGGAAGVVRRQRRFRRHPPSHGMGGAWQASLCHRSRLLPRPCIQWLLYTLYSQYLIRYHGRKQSEEALMAQTSVAVKKPVRKSVASASSKVDAGAKAKAKAGSRAARSARPARPRAEYAAKAKHKSAQSQGKRAHRCRLEGDGRCRSCGGGAHAHAGCPHAVVSRRALPRRA